MSKTVARAPVKGINTVAQETALPKGYVREAVNVDLTTEGTIRRRRGQVLLNTDPLHSLYAVPSRDILLAGQGGHLVQVSPSGQMATPLHPMGHGEFDYCDYNGDVYAVCENEAVWLPADEGHFRPVGVPTPNGWEVEVVTGGLCAGTYQVSMALQDHRGEMSGLAPVRLVEVPEGGGLRFTNMPIHPHWHVLPCVSEANGEVLYQIDPVPAVLPEFVITEPPKGAVVETQHLTPMPRGHRITWHHGRLFVAQHDTVYFSQPMRPRMCNTTEDFIQFVGRIRMLTALDTGVYVGDDRGVWFLQGDDAQNFQQKRVSDVPCVYGSDTVVDSTDVSNEAVGPQGPVALWLTEGGYSLGLTTGQVVPMTDGVEITATGRARTVVRRDRGVLQAITVVESSTGPSDEAAPNATTSRGRA